MRRIESSREKERQNEDGDDSGEHVAQYDVAICGWHVVVVLVGLTGVTEALLRWNGVVGELHFPGAFDIRKYRVHIRRYCRC